jgi:hypothetical protein
MPVAVAMSLGTVVALIPVVAALVTAIPAVAWGRRWWGVVIARRVGVHGWSLGYLVHRLALVDLWPLRPLCVVARLLVGHTAANRGTSRTTRAGTQHRTVAPTHGLAHGCARRAANGTADHRATLAGAMGADGSPCCATEGTANDCALASTHLLAQHRTGRRTNATTQQGADIVGVDGRAQRGQSQRTADKQGCQAHAGRRARDRSFQHKGLGALGPYRQT